MTKSKKIASIPLTRKPKKELIPARVIFTDTETTSDPGLVQFVLGCYEVWTVDDKGMALDKIDAGTYQDTDTFFQLVKANTPCRVVAHNWRFDAAVLRLGATDNMDKHQYSIDVKASILPPDNTNFAPFLVTLSFDAGDATFICNTNYYKQRLADIGESFGIAKMEMPDFIDYEDREEYLEHLEYYCRRDVEILRTSWFFMYRFTDELAETTPGITAAMAANRVYRKRFMPDVHIRGNRPIPLVNDAEIDAYRGGRTDVFYKGVPPENTTVYKYDINSLYPFAMLGNMPVKYLQSAGSMAVIDGIANDRDDVLFLADVSIRIPQDDIYSFIGCEGVKTDDNRYIFPIGEYRAWVWQPMLKIMLDNGYVSDIHAAHAYEGANIFETYVDTLYALRREYKISQDRSRDLLVKLMLNSLYGKFGQKEPQQWTELDPECDEYKVMIHPAQERYNGMYQDIEREYLRLGNRLYTWIPNERQDVSKQSVTSIAGYITSKARATLWDGLRTVIDLNGTLYMCDTDSIICSVELPHDMVDSYKLGHYKLEEIAESEECNFIAPKHYRMGSDYKIKGIRDPGKGINGNFSQDIFPNFITDLTSKNSKRRERLQSGAVITRIVKSPTGDNNKRVEVGPNRPTLPILLAP